MNRRPYNRFNEIVNRLISTPLTPKGKDEDKDEDEKEEEEEEAADQMEEDPPASSSLLSRVTEGGEGGPAGADEVGRAGGRGGGVVGVFGSNDLQSNVVKFKRFLIIIYIYFIFYSLNVLWISRISWIHTSVLFWCRF